MPTVQTKIADAVPPPELSAEELEKLTKPDAAAAKELDKRPVVHAHPAGVCDRVVGVDEHGRRIIHTVPARTPTYLFSCRACQRADRERMAAPPTLLPDATDRTLFLVPESDYDQKVCRAYIDKRYPKDIYENKIVVAAFHAEKLSFVKSARVIVVVRRGKDDKAPGPSTRRMKDAEDVWVDLPIAPETYLDEVVESAPIMVDECIQVVAATMFSEQVVDMAEFVARLAERAFPYRIALPADPKDHMFTMRHNS